MTNPDPNDFVKLATDACEQWQQQLTAFTSDPKAKEELQRLMEPSRQMMSEWSKMVMNAGTMPSASTAKAPQEKPQAAPEQPIADDIGLRLAQLACRVAELEQRIAQLEAEKRELSTPSATAII
jgi:uncharacterized protein YceH (UPF0502 family)